MCVRLYAFIFSTFAGFHPRTSKSWETTRAPGFSCFSSLGLKHVVGAGIQVKDHDVRLLQIRIQEAALA